MVGGKRWLDEIGKLTWDSKDLASSGWRQREAQAERLTASTRPLIAVTKSAARPTPSPCQTCFLSSTSIAGDLVARPSHPLAAVRMRTRHAGAHDGSS